MTMNEHRCHFQVTGNRGGVTGCFSDTLISDWLEVHNPSQLEFGRAVMNFTRESTIRPDFLISIVALTDISGPCAAAVHLRLENCKTIFEFLIRSLLIVLGLNF